jgi:type VI protein secretion system component Hcp
MTCTGPRSAAAGGTTIPKAELDFVKSGDTPFTYFKMTLADVMVSSITLAGQSGGEPTQAVTLAYD